MWGRVSLYNLCAEQRKSQLAKSPWREPGTGSKWISSRGIYCQKRKGFLMKYLPLYLLPKMIGFLTKSIFMYLLTTKGKDYEIFPHIYCIRYIHLLPNKERMSYGISSHIRWQKRNLSPWIKKKKWLRKENHPLMAKSQKQRLIINVCTDIPLGNFLGKIPKAETEYKCLHWYSFG